MMMNPENKKELKILSIFLLSSFVIFLIGIALAVYFIFLAPMNKGKAEGVIKDITNNSTTIVYSANNRTYEKRFSAYSSTYYVGKKVKLYYNKQKPFNSSIAGMRYLSLIAPGIGIILLGVSGILCLVFYKKNINM